MVLKNSPEINCLSPPGPGVHTERAVQRDRHIRPMISPARRRLHAVSPLKRSTEEGWLPEVCSAHLGSRAASGLHTRWDSDYLLTNIYEVHFSKNSATLSYLLPHTPLDLFGEHSSAVKEKLTAIKTNIIKRPQTCSFVVKNQNLRNSFQKKLPHSNIPASRFPHVTISSF